MTFFDSPTTHTPFLIDEDTAARVALAIAGVAGESSIHIAGRIAGSMAELVSAVNDGTDRALPLSSEMRRRIRNLGTGDRVARVLEISLASGLYLITPRHPLWPRQLRVLRSAAPLMLWVAGAVDLLQRESVALTGSVAPSTAGIGMALELGTGLAQRGWVIATGAGSGIHAAAKSAALAMGGYNITVAAGGAEREERNAAVATISELPPGSALTLRQQRRAKYLLAAIAIRCVLIEAGIASGALRTAEAAHALGRPVGVVAGDGTSHCASNAFAKQHGLDLVATIRDAERLR